MAGSIVIALLTANLITRHPDASGGLASPARPEEAAKQLAVVQAFGPAMSGGPDRLRQRCSGPPQQAKAEGLHYDNQSQVSQPREIVTAVRIQGNVVTPDEELIRLAGIQVGVPVDAATVAEAAARLRATKRFQRVEVLKRYASIADATAIVLVIIVDEGPVRIEMTGDPTQPTRVVHSRRLNLLFLPVISGEDGYGVTYGVRVARPDPAGTSSRLSFPATWGGEKLAAAELEKRFDGGFLTRVEGGVSISRRTNPFYDEDDDRRRVWARGERQLFPSLRVGASAGWQSVSFLRVEDRVVNGGADVVLDTRLDPFLARNAVYVRAAWDHLAFRASDGVNRSELDARAYVGLVGQSILVLRAFRDGADRPLPSSFKPILGGTANVRGFRAGTAVGDTLAAGSLELRVPLTSPLSIGKVGVSAFVDAGTAYDHGERFNDRTMKRGVGGGVWFAATVVRINVAVAHGIGASTRVHASGNVSF